jgi:hypothetical protein
MSGKVKISIFLLFLGAAGNASLNAQKVRQLVLDDQQKYTIRTHYDAGVTTILFPGAIDGGIYGANVTADPSALAGAKFLLNYTPGSYFFSVRALTRDAQGALNVIYRRKCYILNLSGPGVEDGGKLAAAGLEPCGSVTFVPARRPGGSRQNEVSPDVLISLLDKAKAYKLFREYYPETLEADQVEHYRPPSVVKFAYTDFDVILDEVIRFGRYDTLVFKIFLVNKTGHDITYDPQLLSVRNGAHIYYQSVTDASGMMPPQSRSVVYFGITGTPQGGRNHLAAANDWTVLVTTHAMLECEVGSEAAAGPPEKMETITAPVDPVLVPDPELTPENNPAIGTDKNLMNRPQ